MTPFTELLGALLDEDPAGALRELDDRARLTAILPPLEAGRGFEQPELHEYTVLEHNLAAVTAFETATGTGEDGRDLRGVLGWLDFDEALERPIEGLPVRTLLRLAVLVHDIAKPETAAVIDGRLRFPRHGPRGAEVLRGLLPDLGFGPAQTDFVARMVRYHLRPGDLVRNWPPTDHAMRRFVNDLDGHVLPLMLVNLADGMATRGPRYTRENYRRHVGLVNYVVARAWAVTEEDEPPLVTGEDLMTTLDLEGGRLLGAVLTSVREAQAKGLVRTREEAQALAHETLAEMRDAASRGG